MEDTIRFIIENRRVKINISDYCTIVLPTGGLLIGGMAMLYNTFKFNHSELLVPSLITIGFSFITLIFLLRKLRIENSYDTIETNLSRKENIRLCEEIIKELFGNVEVHEEENSSLIFFNIKAFFSWGKQITFINEEKRILFNYRDAWAPLTLLGRKRNMNRIKNEINKKANC